MKNRGRTEMLATMLEATKGKATKTKIMYSAFLSYNQLKEYLAVLIKNNLIEYRGRTHAFKTTEKGLKFLTTHNEIGELLQTTIGNDNELI
jgi:predicted transcriptional regulator